MESINLRCKLGESLIDGTDPRRVEDDSAYKLNVLTLFGDVPNKLLRSFDTVMVLFSKKKKKKKRKKREKRGYGLDYSLYILMLCLYTDLRPTKHEA